VRFYVLRSSTGRNIEQEFVQKELRKMVFGQGSLQVPGLDGCVEVVRDGGFTAIASTL
jgi:hypothetical protein